MPPRGRITIASGLFVRFFVEHFAAPRRRRRCRRAKSTVMSDVTSAVMSYMYVTTRRLSVALEGEPE
jgi:hypothetical protein